MPPKNLAQAPPPKRTPVTAPLGKAEVKRPVSG